MEAASNAHSNQAIAIAALKAQVTLLQSSWHDALQSNFRAQSLLTDPDGFVCKIMNLQKQFPDNFTAVSEARNLLRDLCDLQRQVAFTGGCKKSPLVKIREGIKWIIPIRADCYRESALRTSAK